MLDHYGKRRNNTLGTFFRVLQCFKTILPQEEKSIMPME